MEVNDENTHICYLECLPVEIIEIICSHLNAQDVAACCATSRTMRDVFGCDSVWKGRCDTSLAEYLEETPCKVTPHFASPEDPDGTLSPLSYWRVAYMRENHLWNNWRTGNYVEERLISPTWSPDEFYLSWNYNVDYSGISVWRMSQMDEVTVVEHLESEENDIEDHVMYVTEICTPKEVAFLNNDIVVVRFDDVVGFFSFRRSSHTRIAHDIRFSKLSESELIIVSEYDRVIILFKKLVQVYLVSLFPKSTVLDHAFSYDESQELKNVKEPDAINKVISVLNSPQTESRHVTVKDLIVCVSHGESTIHVWNIVTGIKIREEKCPLRGVCVGMKASKSLVVIMVDHTGGKSILAYDLNTLSYLPLQLSSEVIRCSIDFYVIGCYVAVSFKKMRHKSTSKRLNVYNLLTSEIVLKKQKIIPSLGCETVGDSFLFLQKYKLKMYCPYTRSLKCLLILPKSSEFLPLFQAVNPRLILVEKSDRWWELYEVAATSLKRNKLIVNTRNFDRQSIITTATRIIVDKTLMKTFW